MKYGWQERISGALILLALAVIFVPLLFDEPAPREDRPEPRLTIEQPIEVERREPPAPEPPESLSSSGEAVVDASVASRDEAPAEQGGASTDEGAPVVPADTVAEASTEDDAEPEAQPASAPESSIDPIADLARAADERLAASAERTQEAVSDGEWSVQVGSFGEPSNAERLQARLEEQGFPAYRRPRNNDLTSVYVGPYASSEVAEEAMAELKAGLNLQGLLVETE